MEINQVAQFLRLTREEAVMAIETGIELPKSKEILSLKAEKLNNQYDVDEESLDEFIARFHAEEPGRHPPTAVRRKLLVESRHRCAICTEPTYIEFHHIIEFSKIKHYDVRHMLALCPTCHTMCGRGTVDQKSQYEYKDKLHNQLNGDASSHLNGFIGPVDFSWHDLRQVINSLHSSFVAEDDTDGNSKSDFSDSGLQRKNKLNGMSEHYFQTVILEGHEPYFNRIQRFLGSPINRDVNELYFDIVDELRSKIALNRDQNDRFEYFLVQFADIAVRGQNGALPIRRRTLNILLSFMYVNCDIGRK